MKDKYWKMQRVGRGVQGQCYSSEKTKWIISMLAKTKYQEKDTKLPNIHLKCCFLGFLNIVLKVLC